MEEFKKPCLPTAPPKIEDSEQDLKKAKENTANNIESAEPAKSQNPYKIPQWSDRTNDENNYHFEVLKSGQIIDKVKQLQKKAYWSFGRLQENDVEMAHPTISRYHAILQYRPKCKVLKNSSVTEKDNESSENYIKGEVPPEGWYIYDLGSTHGTFLNKQRIPPKVYMRIRVGHILRLGASTRSFILQGPSEDEEPESELSITELKAKRQQCLEQASLEKKQLADENTERVNNEGCGWGMGEDADEESDLTHNPYASTNNEELFLDDPKKTLRGYFEREGLELVYKCDEMSAGSFVCRVELPIDDTNGRSVVAEVIYKGKKKDCVVQCALEACRLLDRHGVLRQANQEPLKRKQKSQESDSDDDEFWDRTGEVARKKQRKANANTTVTLTYEDLLKQECDIDEQFKHIQSKINDYQNHQKRLKSQKPNEGEDLDAFMENLQEKEIKIDKTEIRKLRIEEQRLQNEKQKVQRLIKIAKPIDLSLNTRTTDKKPPLTQEVTTQKKQLPMIGKRNQFSKFKILKVESGKSTAKNTRPARFLDSEEEEVEEKTKDKEPEKLDLKKDLIQDDAVVNDKCEKVDEKTNDTSQGSGFKDNRINETENSNKKRRHRVRQRGKRQEVDMDDNIEYESSDKYAKWIPPENQTGDGFTELNTKFGY